MGHIYYNDKGEPLPSVTGILNIISKKDFSLWANYLGFKHINIKNYIGEKATIGSLVHDKIECYFEKRESKDHFDKEYADKANSSFEQFKKWIEPLNPTIIWQEKEFHNNHYGGRIDMLWEINKEIILTDFKTSKKIGTSHFMQLGGYLNIIKFQEPEMYDRITKCMVVSVQEDHTKVKEKTRLEMLKYQEAFELAYNLYINYDKILREDWNDSLEKLTMF